MEKSLSHQIHPKIWEEELGAVKILGARTMTNAEVTAGYSQPRL